MTNKKMVYVPRNWKVSYTDTFGNEHVDELRANAGYRIVAGGETYNISIAGIKVEEGKTYIIAKVIMTAGNMYTIKKSENLQLDVDSVTEITEIISDYVKTKHSNRDKSTDDESVFTFAFDTAKYSSKYRISVNKGEFVSLAVKDINDPNKKSRSLYGHVVDVDSELGIIEFSRYISNHGVRDVYTQKIDIKTLLGVYRYELQFKDVVIEPKVDDEPIIEESTTENEE